ncbi:MAG: HD-GYP domain-containing protein [Candidatus Aminicenantes bacterium]|jgi:putative nucleotidyltransferase with HDIG domain
MVNVQSPIKESRKEIQSFFEPLFPPNDNESIPLASASPIELALGFPGNPDDFKGLAREEFLEERGHSQRFSSHEGTGTDGIVSFWERGFWEKRKISLAREVLMRLDQRFRKVFRGQDLDFKENGAEKEAFLNPNLLYLIAITDRYEDTLGHSQLVSKYATLFAGELGIEDRNFLFDLENGALLHDIGKIGIPEFVLRKNGPLTSGEKEVVMEHPLLGYQMIEEVDFLKKAAEVVLYHHERYDGTGYPFGLSGEEIPLGARIFALADTLDAITSDRPYRKGEDFEVARREIEKGRESQFDPHLVDIFQSVPLEKWQDIKQNLRKSLPLAAVH